MEKIVLGFSGGVDSAVSALLLAERGFAVHALYLNTGGPFDPESVAALAGAIGVPLTVRDVRPEMERHVCAPFAESYLRGETPNPCILCNPSVKFRSLIDCADALGAAHVATGHYARAENDSLYKGTPQNDQSYMLCRLTREQVSRLVLPLGSLHKDAVRTLARERALPVAETPDSMEICFIPDRDYAGYIERRGAAPPPGHFVYEGRVIGAHRGIHHYTVGQRRHFGVYVGHRVYVSEIRPDTNEVILSEGDEVFADAVRVRDANWLIEPPAGALRATVRVRHTRRDEPAATVTPLPDGGAAIAFDTPVRAPAAGQSAAFYDGDRLLGGGFIVGLV